MADDSEKIALVIETQAQLAGLRQATQGIKDVSAAAASANAAVGSSAAQAAGKIDWQAASYAGLAKQVSGATTAMAGSRAEAQAAAESVSGLGISFSEMAQLAVVGAGGVYLAVTALRAVGSVLEKDAEKAQALGDAFKNHLGNLKLSATSAAIDDVHKKTGQLETQIGTLGQKLYALALLGPSAFTDKNASFFTNLRHELTLTTTAEDSFYRTLKENEALGARNATLVSAMADSQRELNVALSADVRNTSYRAQELRDQIAGNTYAAQRVSLMQQEATSVAEINKRYADQARLRGGPITQTEIAQQQIEINNAKQLLTLGLQLNDVQKARADAQRAAQTAAATSRVRAAGAGSTSDIDGPSATYAKRLLDIDREYDQATLKDHVATIVAKQTKDLEYARAYRDMVNGIIAIDEKQRAATSRVVESGISAGSDLIGPYARYQAERVKDAREADEQINKFHVASSIANAALLAKDARAERDYYGAIAQMQRESDDAIAASRSDLDPLYEETQARLEIWRDYYDTIDKDDERNYQRKLKRDALLARLDRDTVKGALDHFGQVARAAESYGGTVAKLAVAAGEAKRRGELAWNAYTDFGIAKSFAAKSIGAFASGNFVSGAGYAAASTAMFAAAGFEAAGALGGGGGSGSSGGGGYGGGAASTFTPNNDNNKSGQQTIIINTVDPFSSKVIATTMYYMNKAQVLKVPGTLPSAAGGHTVTKADYYSSHY